MELSRRDGLRWASGLLLGLAAGTGAQAQQQPQQIFEGGFRLAAFGARAAGVAATKKLRPEVAEFAAQMRAASEAALARWQAIGTQRGWPIPTTLIEQQTILDNLTPLDTLEFSRRYVEVTMQTLGQKQRVCEAALALRDEAFRDVGATCLARLEANRKAAEQLLTSLRSH